MSRRIKIKTEKPVLINQSFQAKATPYQLLDEEAQIKEAIVENERNEKEKKLLEKELEKPFGKRNKAVVAKYTAANPEVLNGYPKDVTTGKLILTATAVDDPKIQISQRPVPYYRTIVINNNENVLTYKFPIKKEATNDGEEVFKLDNYDVFVDSNGDILLGISTEGSPYEVLYNLINGDNSLAEPYGVKSDGKTYYNFTFPDFLVKYNREKEPKKTGEEASIPKGDNQSITHFVSRKPYNVFEGKQKAIAESIFNTCFNNGVDIGNVETVADAVVVKEMFIGKAKAKARLCYINLNKNGKIISDLISGDNTAVDYIMDNKINKLGGKEIPKSKLKAPIINQIFEEINRTIVGKYKVFKNYTSRTSVE